MPEPLAIIVGATGLIGFAVATIPKLDQFRRDFIFAGDKIDHYQTRLQTAQTRLINWQRLWYDSTYSHEDYIHFWGPIGYEKVSSIIQRIRGELIAIGQILYHRCNEELEAEMHEDWHRWRKWLGNEEADELKKEYASPLRRFAFALFKNQELEERVKRVLERVDDLEQFSQNTFSNVQLLLGEKKHQDHLSLDQLLARRDWMKDQEALFTDLFKHSNALSGPGRWSGKWSLLLTSPNISQWVENQSEIHAKFNFQRQTKNPCYLPESDVVDFCPSDNANMYSWYESVVDRRHQTSRAKRHSDFVDFLFERRGIHDDPRISLAEAMLGIVKWTLLLWGTPWTDNICICRLRFIIMGPMAGRSHKVATFERTDECDKTESYHENTETNCKSFRMGLCVAEAALKEPIIADIGEPEMSLFSYKGSWQPESYILHLVKLRNGPGYRDAVRHCFWYHRQLAANCEFRVDHIHQFQTLVIEKLENYRLAVNEAFQSRYMY